MPWRPDGVEAGAANGNARPSRGWRGSSRRVAAWRAAAGTGGPWGCRHGGSGRVAACRQAAGPPPHAGSSPWTRASPRWGSAWHAPPALRPGRRRPRPLRHPSCRGHCPSTHLQPISSSVGQCRGAAAAQHRQPRRRRQSPAGCPARPTPEAGLARPAPRVAPPAPTRARRRRGARSSAPPPLSPLRRGGAAIAEGTHPPAAG